MKKVLLAFCYHLSILFGLFLLPVSSSDASFTYPRRRQLRKQEQESSEKEGWEGIFTTSDVRKFNADINEDIFEEIEDAINVKQTSFINFRTTSCDKSNPAEYEVKFNLNRGKCKNRCKRKTWCRGFESNKRLRGPVTCALFNVTPNPANQKKRVLCAQKASNWTFHVMSDMHACGGFSWYNLEDNKKKARWKDLTMVLTHIKVKYGGADLVILPGDQVSYGPLSLEYFTDRIGENLSQEEAVYKSLLNSSIATRSLFQEVGYDTVLATIGDHEIGGNRGFSHIGLPRSKLLTHPSHRQGFADGFNRNEENEFIFDQSFGEVLSRPMGTRYENTTFAYVHQNALFVTVDAFELVGDGDQGYIDLENGLGGEGTVTCTVSGEHLTWFESILSYAKYNLAIRHIFVQAHVPIIQPVRIVSSTGQFFDSAEESDFWKIMNKYGVDIYFAGDVHSNTATKSSYNGSNLVQVVSRGNAINNFLTVDITEDIIDIKIYNEYGEKRKYNAQYNQAGHLTIDKSSDTVTKMSSSGMLELLDLKSVMVMFDFEEVFPLGTRQVLAMKSKEKDQLMVTEIVIRNKLCKESFFNYGAFGAQYDAQIHNVRLVEGRNVGKYAGLFDEESRFGVYGGGPLGGGEIMSFGLWFKTAETNREMVLFQYASCSTSPTATFPKVHIILALDNGIPIVNLQPTIILKPSLKLNLADDKWHHIAISMPKKSCLLSELEMYVDGLKINTNVQGDRFIFYSTGGRMNLGGFGYSNSGFEDAYPGRGAFIGVLDDFTLHARPLAMRIDFP